MMQAYECQVEVRHEQFYSDKIKERCWRTTKEMFQFICPSQTAAVKRAQRKGRVLSVRKVAKLEGVIEKLPLNQAPLPQQINAAIAMDEMIWLRRKAMGQQRREIKLIKDTPDY